jgi:hypothetical protein
MCFSALILALDATIAPTMTEIPEQPKKSAGDVAQTIVKAAVSAVPVVGGPAAELIGFIFGPPLERRRKAWLDTLADAVKEVQGRVGELTPEKLSEDAAFITTAMHATEVAMRTHQQEKLDALRNAVINAALPTAPDETVRHTFLSYIDDLTPSHLRILKYFDDPSEWFRSRGMPVPQLYSGSPSQLLEQAMPELKGKQAFYDVIVAGLEQRKLMGGSIHGMVTAAGILAQRSTPFGREFLSFISQR